MASKMLTQVAYFLLHSLNNISMSFKNENKKRGKKGNFGIIILLTVLLPRIWHDQSCIHVQFLVLKDHQDLDPSTLHTVSK